MAHFHNYFKYFPKIPRQFKMFHLEVTNCLKIRNVYLNGCNHKMLLQENIQIQPTLFQCHTNFTNFSSSKVKYVSKLCDSEQNTEYLQRVYTRQYNRYKYRNNANITPFIFLSFALPFVSGEDKNKDEENASDDIKTTVQKSILAMQRGEFDKAEQLLHVVLGSAQNLGDRSAITFIFDLLANLALQKGDFVKAHDIFVEVLKRIIADGVPQDDNSVVEISLKLANIFANLDQDEKASQGFLFCINTQEEKLQRFGASKVDENTLALWAMSHNWYARYLMFKEEFSMAKDHLEKALEVCYKLKGVDDEQTAILLNDLGTITSLDEQYDEALDYFQRAIEIGETKKIDDLASFYINIANVFLMKDNSEKAMDFCKKGLHLAKETKNAEVVREGKDCLELIKKKEFHGSTAGAKKFMIRS